MTISLQIGNITRSSISSTMSVFIKSPCPYFVIENQKLMTDFQRVKLMSGIFDFWQINFGRLFWCAIFLRFLAPIDFLLFTLNTKPLLTLNSFDYILVKRHVGNSNIFICSKNLLFTFPNQASWLFPKICQNLRRKARNLQ